MRLVVELDSDNSIAVEYRETRMFPDDVTERHMFDVVVSSPDFPDDVRTEVSQPAWGVPNIVGALGCVLTFAGAASEYASGYPGSHDHDGRDCPWHDVEDWAQNMDTELWEARELLRVDAA